MFRDTTNASAVISYYYNIISDSNGNLEQTVYKITEADWVITFITKTIS